MKIKLFFLSFTLLFFTGCGVSKKEVVRNDIFCSSEDSSFVLTLEDGKAVKYVDSIDGELGQETVDIINEEHLSNVSDNDRAFSIMDSVMKDLGGSCEQKEE